MTISDINFNMLQFWVQIHGLELDKFSELNAYKIGEALGEWLK